MNLDERFYLGIIASSNGSVFQELVKILAQCRPGLYRYAVVTDRPCGIEEYCTHYNIPWQRIDEPDNAEFSKQAYKFFRQTFPENDGVDYILLYFLRLITSELFLNVPAYNTHPSLLPAYSGFNALKRTLAEKPRYFGATLHVADDSTDNGPIIAQACRPLPQDATLAQLNKWSFLQKVYLGLVLTDLYEHHAFTFEDGSCVLTRNLPVTDQYHPALLSPDKQALYKKLEAREVISV